MTIFKITFTVAIVAAALGFTLNDASARGRGVSNLTACGPDLAYLCPVRGYFDLTPFQYSLTIYPGCIQTQRVQTSEGTRLRRVLVCG